MTTAPNRQEPRHGPVCPYCTFVWWPTCSAVFKADLELSFLELRRACVTSEGPPHLGEDQRLVACAGGCGRHDPVYQVLEGGQKAHVGAWICHRCHSKICEVDVVEDPYHSPCKVLEML